MLIKKQRELGHEIGMIIDLTATYRYYNPKELSNLGVEYKKILVEGGSSLPKIETLNSFCFIINNYNSEKYIGVHCTHGHNRTGLFICYYLCKYKNESVIHSLELFEKSRKYVYIYNILLLFKGIIQNTIY